MHDILYFGPRPNIPNECTFTSDFHTATINSEELARTEYVWFIFGGNDYSNFDFGWTPPPWESEFLHVWGNQLQANAEVYLFKRGISSEFASFQSRYHTKHRVHRDFGLGPWKTHGNWTYSSRTIIPNDVLENWKPPGDRDNVRYLFGASLPPHLEPVAAYTVGNGNETVYIEYIQFELTPDTAGWVLQHPCDIDYTMRFHPYEPYDVVFTSDWTKKEVARWINPHSNGKEQSHGSISTIPQPDRFTVLIDREISFDFSWIPDPDDPPYIYVFGNQWHDAVTMPTVEYRVDGATQKKYVEYPKATIEPCMDNWVIVSEANLDFDFSWVPDPNDPPYIYIFGNQHWSGNESATVEYHVPGATEKKYVSDHRARLKDLDVFIVEKSTNIARKSLENNKNGTFSDKNLQVVRYANSTVKTIRRCQSRATTPMFWVLSSENDYSDFDFNWWPAPWDHDKIHVFPNQWNRWSDTFLIPVDYEFGKLDNIYNAPNVKFMTSPVAYRPDNLYSIVFIDHGNIESDSQYNNLVDRFGDLVTKTRFTNSYSSILSRLAKHRENLTDRVWVVNSICDYSMFDFSWKPEEWTGDKIYVWQTATTTTGSIKQGDTFLIDLAAFSQTEIDLNLLDWFENVVYVDHKTTVPHTRGFLSNRPYVDRFPIDNVHVHDGDLISAIKSHDFRGTSANFHCHYCKPTQIETFYRDNFSNRIRNPVSFWSAETQKIDMTTSVSQMIYIVPREAKNKIKTQIYDYDYLTESASKATPGVIESVLYEAGQLDVVFISNGEPEEHERYEQLSEHLRRNNYKGQLHWVYHVNGRAAAYKEAAKKSTTPWFYAVFAKLEIVKTFQFNWLPNLGLGPKHYIFKALNPVNGLEYGHQAVIAYNKKLVLANTGTEIDFTLSDPHESVDILSGVANFNTDPWTTWRTTFREVVKLQYLFDKTGDIDTKFRLDKWKEPVQSNVAFKDDYEIAVKMAIDYYNSVNGRYEDLLKTVEWDWLKSYFERNKSD